MQTYESLSFYMSLEMALPHSLRSLEGFGEHQDLLKKVAALMKTHPQHESWKKVLMGKKIQNQLISLSCKIEHGVSMNEFEKDSP